MNRYVGKDNQAFVNGNELPLRLDIINHSPSGVAWGYNGSGPSQFALAVMVNEFGEDLSNHPQSYQVFKQIFIANLEGETVTFTSNDILTALGIITLSESTTFH